MKTRLLLLAIVLLVPLLAAPTPVAAQPPCTGGVYADHPALVAECQHNLTVNHHRAPSYKAPAPVPTPTVYELPVPVEPTRTAPPYP